MTTGGATGYGCYMAGPANGFNNGFTAANPVGGNYVALDGTDYGEGTLSQTVNGLTVGQQYKLSFYWGAGSLNTATAGYDRSIGWDVGVTGANQPADLTESLRTGGYKKEGPQPVWIQQTYTFTASSTSEVLAFSTQHFASGHPPIALLDGVSISAVPEPSAWLLMAGGLAIMDVIRRLGTRR